MVRKVEKLDNSFNKYGMDVVAKPVDTYVTPARVGDAGGSYQQLAVALAGLHIPFLNTQKINGMKKRKQTVPKANKCTNKTETGNRGKTT